MLALENKETKFLIMLIQKHANTNWFTEKIISKLKEDIDEKHLRSKCDHSFAKYIGEKTCCGKCGTYDVGMGEKWIREDFYKSS